MKYPVAPLRLKTLLFFVLSVLSVAPSKLCGQYYSVQTKNLNLVFYDQDHYYVVPHTGRCFENSLTFYGKLFGYTPSEPVLILLQDFSDYGYAGATSLPFNFMTVGMESFEYVYETSPTNERMNWVMSHELTHIVASDKAAATDKFFRSLFLGKVMPTSENPLSMLYTYLTNPRRYAPRWYHEGIAVFMETWMSGGIGRVLGGYDEMVFRTMVRDSVYFYDFVGLESEGTAADFEIGQNSYLYGTRFLSHLSSQYGPEKVLKWYNRTDESKADYVSQFQNVYGVQLDEEWSKWIRSERDWQDENLKTIRTVPVTPFRSIFAENLGAVSRSHYDPRTNKLYAAVNYPGSFAHIEEIDVGTGSRRRICDVPTPAMYYVTSLAYDSTTGTLFFTTQNSWMWRDLNAVDVKTGKTRIVLQDTRTGDLVFSAAGRALWGVRHRDGYSSLVRIGEPYAYVYPVATFDYRRDIYDIDVSPDGRYVTASLLEVSGRVKLIRMDVEKLLKGDASYEELYEFENNSPANFVFSPDGKYLFGTSYYTGVSNVYRYDFTEKKMEVLTNSETGFFRPLPLTEDSLLVWRYSKEGFSPVAIAVQSREDVPSIKYLGQETVERFPVVTTWAIGSPLAVNIDSLITYKGEYGAFRDARLASLYPVVEGYKDFVSGGIRTNVGDPLGLNRIDLTASFSPTSAVPPEERVHASLRYRSILWNITATYNRADFYDLFGPTKTSRKGYSLSLQYKNDILNDPPRSMGYSIGVAGYAGLQRLPDYQNVDVSFDRFLTGQAKINYKNTRKTLGGLEPEEGVLWDLQAQGYYVKSTLFPRIFGNVDYGFLLPIHHSSLWLRTSAGFAHGDRGEPFANFYFGGFGNNWVDYADAKRYREYYSFPGAELNAIGGTNYGKLMLEWTLPPLRFRRLGVPSFYCTWAHASLFSSVISTNLDSPPDRNTYANVGGQADFKMVVFSRLDVTLSVGAAMSAERNQRPTNEFMISLKIL